MTIKFKALGYGEKEDVTRELRGPWIVIRDDDAAVVGADSCWFAVAGLGGIKDDVVKAYEEDGGTVSEVFEYYG